MGRFVPNYDVTQKKGETLIQKLKTDDFIINNVARMLLRETGSLGGLLLDQTWILQAFWCLQRDLAVF